MDHYSGGEGRRTFGGALVVARLVGCALGHLFRSVGALTVASSGARRSTGSAHGARSNSIAGLPWAWRGGPDAREANASPGCKAKAAPGLSVSIWRHTSRASCSPSTNSIKCESRLPDPCVTAS
eukprot:1355285-Pleurochrysis_carterae.AAC.7